MISLSWYDLLKEDNFQCLSLMKYLHYINSFSDGVKNWALLSFSMSIGQNGSEILLPQQLKIGSEMKSFHPIFEN